MATAQELLAQMIAEDLSRESMEGRITEVELKARAMSTAERTAVLTLMGEVRSLLNREKKLAAAGILAGRNRLPYSQR